MHWLPLRGRHRIAFSGSTHRDSMVRFALDIMTKIVIHYIGLSAEKLGRIVFI